MMFLLLLLVLPVSLALRIPRGTGSFAKVNANAFVHSNRRTSTKNTISSGIHAVFLPASPPRHERTSIHSTPPNPNGTTNNNGNNNGNSNANQDFWAQQKELALEMTSQNSKSLRQTQQEKFEARRLALVYDTAQFAVYIFCGCWLFFDSPFTAFSYAFGATLGLAYSFGLGKSVETIGQSIDDVIEGKGGAGVGEARYAFLILLIVFVGKYRGEMGLQEIPSIAGFFTYQIASLNQGLREIND